ncbi:MAG: FAD-dependent oxidoreductase, partial [Planctomycetota bacterium]|nr:FAD-dependent oxidoreductase [Planctomycetota bacterium]
EKSGQVRRYSDYTVKSVLTDSHRVLGVKLTSTSDKSSLTVRARMTIDASDWGDVIKGSGAKWDAGIDAKAEFGEPSAPHAGEPATDMNPITWCMILEQRKTKSLFPKPAGYDPRYFNQRWGWIKEQFAYTSRRLVDGRGIKQITHPDVILINTPPIDYPLDVYPADVASALEATEAGASRKNIVAMTPAQREIVFRNARKHSLKFYYHLQQQSSKFRYMALSDEFGTIDKLPPKPYIRESLRLVAQHIVREQEVSGFAGRSNYAMKMYPDAVFSWQFELDFHPTRRSWTTDQGERGPWEAAFRDRRRFGRNGTGRCVFPLRALVPKHVYGLLAAQKNLGFTSIVSSSCRLHDQSIHAGQASGAVAAVSLRHNDSPGGYYLQPERLAEIWSGLLEPENGAPLAIWPFADVDPFDPGFVAIQQLALLRLLPLGPSDTSFRPDQAATSKWMGDLTAKVAEAGYRALQIVVTRTEKRRNIALIVWNHIKNQPLPRLIHKAENDADGDGIENANDPLPFTPGLSSWILDPNHDGLPAVLPPFAKGVRAFNFTSAKGPKRQGFVNDSGQSFDDQSGSGWRSDLSRNTRLRNFDNEPLRDGFVFTRKQDVWECKVENGRWKVYACFGDAEHPQPGQQLSIESKVIAKKIDTSAGQFHEVTTVVTVSDGRLTVTIGDPDGGSNTCINWVILEPM